MSNFATLSDLTDRLDWTLDDDETRIANSALEDLSNAARHHGRNWDAISAPAMVKTVVLAAAVRFMRNPEGYIQSRSGDETVIWSDTHRQGGSAAFSADEIELLAALAGRTDKAFGTAPTTSWGPSRYCPRPSAEGYVPVDYGGDPFPFFCSDTSPW